MDNAPETTILIGILKCTLFFGWQAVDRMLCLTTAILVSVVTAGGYWSTVCPLSSRD